MYVNARLVDEGSLAGEAVLVEIEDADGRWEAVRVVAKFVLSRFEADELHDKLGHLV